MKRADFIRLGLAYALIAASVTKSEKHPPGPKPTAAAGAASPADIPSRGWVEIARSVWTKVGKNRVPAVAAGLTFYGILALFPAITALVSTYGLFADPADIQRQLAQLSGVVPDGAISVIGDQVTRIAAQGSQTLGLAFLSGLALALWSANAGVKALFDALNVAYEVNETRGFIRLNAITLLFTLSGIVLVLAALSLAIVLPWVLEHFFFGYYGMATIMRWLTWPIGMAIALLLLAIVYRFGPAVKKPAWRWITPGSLFATIVLIVASGGFAYYAAHFGSYNKTYGALGAAIGFMTWLWISAIVVMVGAEINAEVERQAKGIGWADR